MIDHTYLFSNNKIDLYFNLLKYNPYTHTLTYVPHGNDHNIYFLTCILDPNILNLGTKKLTNNSNSVGVVVILTCRLLDIMPYTSPSRLSIIESVTSISDILLLSVIDQVEYFLSNIIIPVLTRL